MSTPPTPQAAMPPIAVGTRLTDYSSLDLVVEGGAEGGYGVVVWGPNHAQGSHMTALKLLRPDLLARAETQPAAEGNRMRREFEREALTWCHLWPHADIITANGMTRLPGRDNLPVLILEYAPLGSLRQTLSEGQSSRTSHLSLRTALAWGQQIAAALATIHRPDLACERPEPLIHCDLKPENVLVDADGWAKLTDLGLTRAYAASAADGAATSASSRQADVAEATQARGQGAGDARDVRLAQMRAALQAAGLITPAYDASDAPAAATVFAAKGGVALGQGQETHTQARRDAGVQTRSVRVPPLSAALLTTLLAPRSASPGHAADPFAASNTPGTPLQTEPGIGGQGPVAGTPPYMPPEQWWGLDAVTPASDVYALGVLLFELFAGGAWSPQQQRWLDDDQDSASTGERYVRFPHAPQFTAEALAYLEGWGGLLGQQAYFAAWYAAHRSGPRWRLADPAVGALTRGPLVDVVTAGLGDGQAAQQALTALSDLIAACLAPNAAQRPTAEQVQRRLGEIAQLVGMKPVVIPEVFIRTPEHEADFWGNLAITYGKIGQYEERLRLRRRQVALNPTDPGCQMNLGVAFFEMERYEEALAAHAEAERLLTPDFQAREPQRGARLTLSVLINQANALERLGRYDEAIAIHRRVLAQHAGRLDARFNLAVAFSRWSDVPGASRAQQIERLRAARVEIRQVLFEAPGIANGQALLSAIEQRLTRLGDE